jgi:hypothetical protein
MGSRVARLLASLAAGIAVSLAVPAYAAGLLHEGSGLASGAAVAMGCDTDGVTTRYSVAAGPDGFVVDAVDVGGIDPGCIDGMVHVELRAADGAVLATGSAEVAGSTQVVDLLAAPPPREVSGVHVVLSR